MKGKLKFLLFGIILLVSLNLFFNAKTHVDTVESAEKFKSKSDSLTTKVVTLKKEKDSAISKIEILDSTLTVKDEVIEKQSSHLNKLKNESMMIKQVGPIIIHDTIYITETKNFWGKKKTSIEQTTSVDTLEVEVPVSETDTVQ